MENITLRGDFDFAMIGDDGPLQLLLMEVMTPYMEAKVTIY